MSDSDRYSLYTSELRGHVFEVSLLSNIVIFFNFSGASSDKVTCWAYPGVFLGRIGQRRARKGRQGVLQGSNFNDGP